VYVADRNNNRVDKFGPSGEFLLAWGEGVADGKEEPETCGPATEPATAECHAGLPGGAAGELAFPGGVAVDGSSLDGSTGDVYVEDLDNHRVDKFTAAGKFLLAWGEGVADGKEEAEMCGPEATVKTCRAAIEPHVEGTGEGPGEFERMAQHTIAVDSTGTVYVGDISRVQEFSGAGAYKLTVSITNVQGTIEALAVDEAHHLYVMLGELGGVREYEGCAVSCTGTEGPGPLREPEVRGSNSGIAVGPSGELFIASANERRVTEWDPAGNEVADFPSPGAEGGAAAFADEAGRLLVLTSNEVEVLAPLADVSQPPLIESEVGIAQPAATATVTASIDPENSQTRYHVVYGPEGGGMSETAPVALAVEGFTPETVEVKLEGLKPNTAYQFHFVAENTVGPSAGADEQFAALPPLMVDSESVSQVSATSARLEGELNPLGSETHYVFSYGPTSACGGTECTVPAGEGDAGSGTADVPVDARIEGLSPGVTYRYRLIAHNPLAPPEGIAGEEHQFTTQPATSSTALIDGREWEMVSPPDKHGAPLTTTTEEVGLVQASEDGSRITYFAFGPIDARPEGSRSFALQQQLSSRTAPGLWATQDLATRQEEVRGLLGFEDLTEYKMFSPNLSSGLVEPEGATPLSKATTERTPYLRDDETGEYLPLLPAAGMRPGVKFGGEQESVGNSINFGVQFLTATPDLSHVLLTSEVPLTTNFKEGFEDNPGGGEQYHENLYEWSAGTLKLVSVLPGGEPTSEASPNARVGLGDYSQQMRNAVSADGSRIVFEAVDLPGVTKGLFLRDTTLGQTLRLDVPQEPITGAGGSEEPIFVDANADGSRIFFTDTQRLTQASIARDGAPSLYMCEVTVVAGALSCSLKDLSGEILGADLGADETGTYIYYATGTSRSPGLVVENVETGETKLIAALSEGDAPDWADGESDFGRLTSRVSGNGRYLAFMSDRSLTGYDNRDARSGQPDEEVYLYDRVANTLRCVSCDPSGARPQGVFDPGTDSTVETALLVDETGVWSERWLAGSLPGWPKISTHAVYQPRNLDNSGRLFFDSADALVPQDVNGKEDVYEYEPDDVGGCTLTDGCVGLISSGASSEESAFLDASGKGLGGEEGEDVFFMTSAKLVAKDVDSARDVYDAHTCSEAVPCASTQSVVPPACATAESCRAAPAPQPDIFGAPASATFSGPGDAAPQRPPAPKGETAAEKRAKQLARALRACRAKHNRHKRKACERAADRAYGPARKAARQATTSTKPNNGSRSS
jgi:DNA-binding beta-propeller fold protein YncE